MTQTVIKKDNKTIRVFTTGSFSLTQESWVRPKTRKHKTKTVAL